jgi:hypothetical protein
MGDVKRGDGEDAMNSQTLNALPLPTYEVYNCVTTTFS